MLNITVDRECDKPLYAQIRDEIKKAIWENQLKPGEKLPTVNSLASSIGVTPSTIHRAMEDLNKDGDVYSQVGRGTFVCDELVDRRAPAKKPAAPDRPRQSDPEVRKATIRMRQGISKSLDTLMALDKRAGLIRFSGGVPGPNTLEPGILQKMTQKALEKDEMLYQTCSQPQGLWELRQVVAARYRQSGIELDPDQVLITNGSQQALSLLALHTRDSGIRFICETPCYTGIPNAFGTLGHWVEHVPRDEQGPQVERMQRFDDGRRSLLYICPELHNPMGKDLSPERRQYLIEWANRNNSLIVADEIFRDLRNDGEEPRSLLADLEHSRIAVVGSISKSFMAGLRVGWLIGSHKMVKELAALKRCIDLSSPTVLQGAVYNLMSSGAYDEHLKKARGIYQGLTDTLLSALEKNMPEGIIWTEPLGGFHLWVTLPQGYSSIVLFMLAVEQGVSFIPGPYLDIDHRFVGSFRLSYPQLTKDQIREGVELMAFAVKKLVEEPPGDTGLSGLGDFL
jgi:DNA-binding transcriptional MocR family regulator